MLVKVFDHRYRAATLRNNLLQNIYFCKTHLNGCFNIKVCTKHDTSKDYTYTMISISLFVEVFEWSMIRNYSMIQGLQHTLKLLIQVRMQWKGYGENWNTWYFPYFPVFSLNTGKYGPEKIPYLDTFHAM